MGNLVVPIPQVTVSAKGASVRSGQCGPAEPQGPLFSSIHSHGPSLLLPSVPQTHPPDQAVCDLTRKLTKGNTLPDPGGKKPTGGTKNFPSLPVNEELTLLGPQLVFHPPLLPPSFHHG